jgi:hypothetical protein
MTELFAAQLEREAPICRRILERVPEGRQDWKPHEKSMPLGYLATLVATMPTWVSHAVTLDALDLNPPGGSTHTPRPWTRTPELLQTLEESVASGLAALRKTSDEHLMTPWKLQVAGNTVMESPRHVVIEDTLLHLSHHRGQLSVYLRLNDVPLPSLYGPTADDRSFG